MPVAQDLDFLDPQLLRRGLEARLAGAAGRVRIAGTLDRRLAFIERQDGRWAVADLAGTPHRDRAWPSRAGCERDPATGRVWPPTGAGSLGSSAAKPGAISIRHMTNCSPAPTFTTSSQNDSGERVNAVPRDHLIVRQGGVPGGGPVGTVHALPG